jgi:hypothetical protein
MLQNEQVTPQQGDLFAHHATPVMVSCHVHTPFVQDLGEPTMCDFSLGIAQ